MDKVFAVGIGTPTGAVQTPEGFFFFKALMWSAHIRPCLKEHHGWSNRWNTSTPTQNLLEGGQGCLPGAGVTGSCEPPEVGAGN